MNLLGREFISRCIESFTSQNRDVYIQLKSDSNEHIVKIQSSNPITYGEEGVLVYDTFIEYNKISLITDNLDMLLDELEEMKNALKEYTFKQKIVYGSKGIAINDMYVSFEDIELAKKNKKVQEENSDRKKSDCENGEGEHRTTVAI